MGLQRQRMSNLRYVLCGAGLLLVALLLLGYFHFKLNEADPVWGGILGSVVAAILLSILGYVLLGSRGIYLGSMQSEAGAGSVITFYPDHEEVDWDTILRSARKIDIIVHYYGRWARRHDKAFIDFFQRGGKLRVVMTDPKPPKTLSALHEHFFENLDRAELRQKIEATVGVFRDLHEQAGSAHSSLLVYYFPRILHYAAILTDDQTLYLSVYEQFRGNNVRSSVFGIDLTKDKELQAYWLENRDRFLALSRLA